MYVISGCPRSGTSLMMDLMRVAYGEERLLGTKFPSQDRIEKAEKQRPNESDEKYRIRKYVMDRMKEESKVEKRFEETKDMNPNGFWEMLYTVQGCHYRFGDLDRLDKLLKEEKKSFCKIVSQGLANSDPKYVDKVIFMIRHPRAVAKSQERLRRPGPMGAVAQAQIDGENIKIHTPEMFIDVTGMASKWIIRNPEIPIYHVLYDELLEKPEEILDGIQEFIGEKGNISEASKQINKKLRRSMPEEVDNPLWEDAEFVYEKFLEREYEEIVKYLSKPDIVFNRMKERFTCLRSRIPVNHVICSVCRNKKSTYIDNQKKILEKYNIDWRNEPCIFECGYNYGFKQLTVEESIKHNFWEDGVDPLNIEEQTFFDSLFGYDDNVPYMFMK